MLRGDPARLLALDWSLHFGRAGPRITCQKTHLPSCTFQSLAIECTIEAPEQMAPRQ